MKSHIIPLLLLVGVICAALIAAHPHDFIGLSDEDELEESSGSGNNSAEEFMNEMEALIELWEEDTTTPITDRADSTEGEKEILGPRIIKLFE